MIRSITILAVITITPLLAMPAAADTRIKYVDEDSGESKTEIAVKGGDVRLDDSDGNGYTLYRSSDRTLVFVDHDDKTYMEMDEASMEEMSGQVNEAMKEMQEQLEKMPPAQREMAEKMMGKAKDTGKSMFEMKVDRSGETMNKAGYECERVTFSVGKMTSSELCVVDPGKIDMPAADRKALDSMQEQMRALADKMTQNIGVNFTFDFDSMGGMPVYMKEDSKKSAEVLEDVSSGNLDASMFEIPDGYRQESMSLE